MLCYILSAAGERGVTRESRREFGGKATRPTHVLRTWLDRAPPGSSYGPSIPLRTTWADARSASVTKGDRDGQHTSTPAAKPSADDEQEDHQDDDVFHPVEALTHEVLASVIRSRFDESLPYRSGPFRGRRFRTLLDCTGRCVD